MKIYLARHGETPWNAEHRLQGQKGEDLNEKGVRLAKVTAEALKDVPFDLVITSPLPRAEHTARILIGDRKIPFLYDDRLKEISFGIWEGRHYQNPDEVDVEAFAKFHTDPFHYNPPKGGEDIHLVMKRCSDFFRELTNKPEYEDKTVLISSHGCAVRAMLNSFYEDSTDFWQGNVPPNCSVNILQAHGGKASLLEKDVIYYDPNENTPWFSE